jgi:hypothetical protein
LSRQAKEADNVNLWVRGYIKYDCMYYYRCSGNERIAQVIALRFAAERAEGRSHTSTHVDWEVSNSRARRKGTQFADIMTHWGDDQWNISEVKEYTGPATTSQVSNQLDGYSDLLNGYAQQSNTYVSVDRDPQYMGFFAEFKGRPNLFGDQDTYVEWSPEPGHIYFRKESDLKKSKDQQQKDIATEADAFMKQNHQKPLNGWGNSSVFSPGEGPLSKSPLPDPVLVPVI